MSEERPNIEIWWDGGGIFDCPTGQDCEEAINYFKTGRKFVTSFFKTTFLLMMAGF